MDPEGHFPFLILLALVGAAVALSQVPSDQYQANPANRGNGAVFVGGVILMIPGLVEAACLDGDCTNESQALGKALESASQNGNTTSEGAAAADAAAKTAESITYTLETYLLNPEHPRGSTMAVWYQKALGFTKQNMGGLAKQLIFDAKTAIETGTNQYGTKYNQVISITGANGKAIDIIVVWIKLPDGTIKLVTTVPVK